LELSSLLKEILKLATFLGNLSANRPDKPLQRDTRIPGFGFYPTQCAIYFNKDILGPLTDVRIGSVSHHVTKFEPKDLPSLFLGQRDRVGQLLSGPPGQRQVHLLRVFESLSRLLDNLRQVRAGLVGHLAGPSQIRQSGKKTEELPHGFGAVSSRTAKGAVHK
jgi:hypothetical protein